MCLYLMKFLLTTVPLDGYLEDDSGAKSSIDVRRDARPPCQAAWARVSDDVVQSWGDESILAI
jgi:hypothetical protein